MQIGWIWTTYQPDQKMPMMAATLSERTVVQRPIIGPSMVDETIDYYVKRDGNGHRRLRLLYRIVH